MSRLPGQHFALAGLTLGLLISPGLDAPAAGLPLLPVLLAGVAGLARSSGGSRRRRIFVVLVPTAVLAGLLIGDARLEAIAAGALEEPNGRQVVARGTIGSTPRRLDGEVRFLLSTEAGRVVVVAREPVGELPLGAELVAAGRLGDPEPWREDELRRAGATLELRTRTLRLTGADREGLAGTLDDVRGRAETALATGISSGRAALARGFVLGQDDAIDSRTREQFRDAGLSHLLAVSGQNVILLAILTGALLAVAGIRLRLRLLLIAMTVAAYVPIAGAGASIQRAGMMGVAGIVATLSSRPRDRAWVILIAAAGTLALNPRVAGEVGWQLSFAAVLGISLWSGLLRDLLLHGRDRRAQPGRAVADAVAVTLAATAATTPLLIHHFETLSLAALPANLLAAPAVAPVMWLGMLAGMLGQLPVIPLEPITAPMGVLISYIAAVAEWFSSQSWASIELNPPGEAETVLLYGGLGATGLLLRSSINRRRGLGVGTGVFGAELGARVFLPAALLIVALLVLGRGPSATLARPPDALRVTTLDVGQGDAILLEPARGMPVLVDGGNPGSGAAEALEERGIESLAAVVATHGDLDHAGGLHEVLEDFEVQRLIRGVRVPRLEALARRSGIRVLRVAEGDRLRLGGVKLDVLWPPPDTAPGAEPNVNSLILLVRWQGMTALLTGDAEFEAAGPEPPPVDVLKIPHHGSADAGLGAALDRSLPAVALISAGAGNDYGHPTAETLSTLAEHGVCTLRTDLSGDLRIDLSAAGVSVADSGLCPP